MPITVIRVRPIVTPGSRGVIELGEVQFQRRDRGWVSGSTALTPSGAWLIDRVGLAAYLPEDAPCVVG